MQYINYLLITQDKCIPKCQQQKNCSKQFTPWAKDFSLFLLHFLWYFFNYIPRGCCYFSNTALLPPFQLFNNWLSRIQLFFYFFAQLKLSLLSHFTALHFPSRSKVLIISPDPFLISQSLSMDLFRNRFLSFFVVHSSTNKMHQNFSAHRFRKTRPNS